MATEEKKYLVNIESNLDKYIKEAELAKKRVDELKIANMLMTKDTPRDEVERNNAALRDAQKDYRNATKSVDLATQANKAQSGSYEQLYKQWQLAQTQLKLMGSAYTVDAKGIRILSDKYIENKKAVEDAKRALDAFGKGIADNRLNVGNYGEAVSQAFSDVGKSMMAMLGPAALVTAAVALGKKIFDGLKEAIMSTTFAINIMNIAGEVTKQIFYDIAINGKFSAESIMSVVQATRILNELRTEQYKVDYELAKINRERASLELTAQDQMETTSVKLAALTETKKLDAIATKMETDQLKKELAAVVDLIKTRPEDEKLRARAYGLMAKIENAYARSDQAMKRVESRRSGFLKQEIADQEKRVKMTEAWYEEIEQTNIANAKKKDEEIKKDFKRWSDYWDKIDALEVEQNKKKDAGIEKDFKRWSDYWDKRDALEAERSKRDISAGFELQKIMAQGNLDVLNIILDNEYKALTQSVEYQRLTNNEKLLADQQYTDAKRELSLIRMDQHLWEADLIGDIAGSLSNLFQKQTVAAKALSVSQALISTYTAGVKAMAELPLGSGPILRFLTLASVIAAGLLQVKNILAVKVPGGGGGGESAPAAISASMPAMRIYAQPVGATFLNQPQLTQPQINALPNQNLLTAADIAAAISKLPPPIVTVEDINAKTASVRKIEVRGTI